MELGIVLSDNSNQPDLIIYMNDSKQIKPGDLVDIFKNLNIKIPCILITDPQIEIIEEKLLNSGIIKQHIIQPVSLKDIRNAIQTALRPKSK